MTDALLPYYHEELSHIRNMAAEFAAQNPNMATHLGVGADAVEDPHVERLIEAFAYLNARIRHKLDDDFPELTDALLGVLYPHYLAPVPSMAIAQLHAQTDLAGCYDLAAGVEIETEPVDGEPCRFRTCYAVSLWPIHVAGATYTGTALGAPSIAESATTNAVLKLSLASLNKDASFDDLQPSGLTFYLRGQSQIAFALYEALFNDTIRVALDDPDTDEPPRLLDSSSICPVGFERDQGMLPYTPQSFIGYRLLTELFAFPEKFLFFELADLGSNLADVGQRLDVYIYFGARAGELEQGVDKETFALGCTPTINLFTKRAEPIQFDHTTYEYRVVPDVRRPKAAEVYAIENVSGGTANARVDYPPLYGFKHRDGHAQTGTYWQASRRTGATSNPGSEVFLSFVDLALDPATTTQQVVHVDTTCLNRDLPARLPFGGGEPRLRLAEGSAAIENVECLTKPTPTLRSPRGRAAMWRLMSHVNLNHLSITDGEQGAAALREILKLYDFRDSAQTVAMIEGIVSVQTRAVTARMPGSRIGALVRGLEITLELDPQQFVGTGCYLFAAVLERFLALYCGINSFTRLVVQLRGRDGVFYRWPARAGEQANL